MRREQRIRRILLTGGGTAGHVNPALAIGSALASEETQLLYVGVRGRAEEVIVPRAGIPIRFVRASGYPGLKPSAALVRFAVNLVLGTLQAIPILLRFRPQVVVATGGYAAAPVLCAAVLLRALKLARPRVVLHEQNAQPGRLNQLMGRAADRVFVTFAESVSAFPGNSVVTGYPLRKRIAALSREEAVRGLDFVVPPGRKVVFAFGGSMGARTINRAVVDALGTLAARADEIFLVHGLGLAKGAAYDAVEDTARRLAERTTEEERKRIETFYVARPFFHEIEKVYAIADLVITRGGAGSLNEVAALGLPALVIPKANLPGDHQVMNARALQRAAGVEILYEETVLEDGQIVECVDGRRLATKMLELLDEPDRLAAIGRRSREFFPHDALARIHELVAGGAAGHAPPAAEAPAGSRLDEPFPGNAALLSLLEREAARAGAAYTPAAVLPDAGDLEYATSRAASLLASEAWETRNLGVKLLGLLLARDRLPLLLTLLADRTPAPFLERLLGGDYVQVGFIRRNVLSAIARFGVVSPDVEEALLRALEDPYYEARAESARAILALGCRLQRKADIVERLAARLFDHNFEVACAAAEALGAVGAEDDALPPLLALEHAKLWKLRAAGLRGILTLVERGAVRDVTRLRAELPGFALTSTDFRPQFEIKALYARLDEAVEKRA